MKVAWLCKLDSEDDWQIMFTEPPSHYSEVKMIVYTEVEPGEPT
jgi:hypothetical protein